MGASIAWLVVQKPDSAELQEFFNFAAAVASLFLAIVAIFYSMISTQDQSTLLHTTREAAERVDRVSITLDQTSGEVRNLIGDLVSKFDTIPQSVKELQNDLSRRIDEFSSNSASLSGNEEDIKGHVPNIGGHLSLYVLARMYETGRSVDTDKLKSEVDNQFCDILFGFLSCMSTFKPCEAEINAAGSSFAVPSIGRLPVDAYIERDFSSISDSAKEVKTYFDKYFGVSDADTEDTAAANAT